MFGLSAEDSINDLASVTLFEDKLNSDVVENSSSREVDSKDFIVVPELS